MLHGVYLNREKQGRRKRGGGKEEENRRGEGGNEGRRERDSERFSVFFFGTSQLVKLFGMLCHRQSEFASSVSLPLTV